jgi:hypothetical protein
MIIGKDFEESGNLILKHYPSIRLEGLSKTEKNLSKHRRSPGRYLNQGPPENETRVLTTRPRHGFCNIVPCNLIEPYRRFGGSYCLHLIICVSEVQRHDT